MKLRFRQRAFSWLDSYDVFDVAGEVVFRVKGQLALGHKLLIQDVAGAPVATLREVFLTMFKPRFEMIIDGAVAGTITKELTLFKPNFTIDFNGWQVEGNFWEWDYSIVDADGRAVAAISKELWKLTDTYTIDVADPQDALYALMVVLAIDAEKCSRG